MSANSGYRPAKWDDYYEIICESGQSFTFQQNTVVIGRSPECDLTLKQPTISRFCCRVIREDDLYYVEDLGTVNGISVNGRLLRKNVREQVSVDDQINVGDLIL